MSEINLTSYERCEDEGIDFENFNLQKELDKFIDIEPVGWKLVIRLFVSPKKKGDLHIPDSRHGEEQYENCVGLVVHVPSGAYKDERYKHTGAWCKVGDLIAFPRHAGERTVYDGYPIFSLNEDGLLYKVKDPRKVSR